MRPSVTARASAAAMPDFLVIGAMKCGTTSLNRYLGMHPSIDTPARKELNFFFGEHPGGTGNLWRGLGWYRRQFSADAAVRGEASPGYTSPDHPGVAARIAALLPRVKLLYLVRDPFERAVSQYLHHRRDGDERRPVEEALLDRHSHYVRRSRYHERLRPFLDRFPHEQLLVIDQRDLLIDRRETLRRVFAFLGVAPDYWSHELDARWNVRRGEPPALPEQLRPRFLELVADDVIRLQQLAPSVLHTELTA